MARVREQVRYFKSTASKFINKNLKMFDQIKI